MMGLTDAEAVALATIELALPDARHGFDPRELVHDCELTKTIERPWGWVFFYESVRYLESGDLLQPLLGNAPLFVHKHYGILDDVSGTARPLDHYLTAFEANRGQWMGPRLVPYPPLRLAPDNELW